MFPDSWQLKILVIFLSSSFGQEIFRICERDFCYERIIESENIGNKRYGREYEEKSSGRVKEFRHNHRVFEDARKNFPINERSDITRHLETRKEEGYEFFRQLPFEQYNVLRKLNDHFDINRSSTQYEGNERHSVISEKRGHIRFNQERNFFSSEYPQQRILINKREHLQENVRLITRERPSPYTDRFEENEQKVIKPKKHLQLKNYLDARQKSDNTLRHNRNERTRETLETLLRDKETMDVSFTITKKIRQFEHLDKSPLKKEPQRRTATTPERDTIAQLTQSKNRDKQKGSQRRFEIGPNVGYLSLRSVGNRQTVSLDKLESARNRRLTSFTQSNLLSNSEIQNHMRRRSENNLTNRDDEKRHLVLSQKHFPEVRRRIFVEELNRRTKNISNRQERGESLRVELNNIETLNRSKLQYRYKRSLRVAEDNEERNRKSIKFEYKAEHERPNLLSMRNIGRKFYLVRDAKSRTDLIIEESRQNKRNAVRDASRNILASERNEYYNNIRRAEFSLMSEHKEQRLEREIQNRGRRIHRLETARFGREEYEKIGETSLNTLQQLAILRNNNHREEVSTEGLRSQNRRNLKADDETSHLYTSKAVGNDDQREYRESKLRYQHINKAPATIRLQEPNASYRYTRLADQDLMQTPTVLRSSDYKALTQVAILIYVFMTTFKASSFVKNPLPVKVLEALKVIGC